MPDVLLNIVVVEPPFTWIVYGLAIVGLGYLFARRPNGPWIAGVVFAIILGAGIGFAAVFVAQDMLNVFNTPIDWTVRIWVMATCAAVTVSVANLWNSTWLRKLLGLITIPVFILAGATGINAHYGLERTLGDVLEVNTLRPIEFPGRPADQVPPAAPLYQTWDPSEPLPEAQTGTVHISPVASGFPARDAVVWLPPAALVPNAPALPVLVMMNGQPGAPGVQDVIPSLSAFADAHRGLAPIVVSVDQLGGDPANNPLCIDGYQGNAETYVMTDVVSYLNTRNVVAPGTGWAVAGFSNGGTCAVMFGAKHPDVFGEFVDVSGELAPETGSADETVQLAFAGDQTAYDAIKPLTTIQGRTYDGTLGIFVAGSEDGPYLEAAETLRAAAQASGMQTELFISPGTGHEAATIRYGFDQAFPLLFERWGLTAPSS